MPAIAVCPDTNTYPISANSNPFLAFCSTIVEQNAKKGLEFADIGYVLVSGQTAIAGKGDELLQNPDVGRLFLGG